MADFPRYGIGEVTSFREAQKLAREHFLFTAQERYPSILTELAQLAESLPAKVELGYYSASGLNEREAIHAYCRKWGLTNGAKVADWAPDVVANTIAVWRRTRNWCWQVPGGGPTKLSSEDYELGIGFRFNLHIQRLKKAKEQIPRRFHTQLTDLCQRASEANGVVLARRKYNQDHYVWTVKHQLEGVSYDRLADPEEPDAQKIKIEVTGLKRLIGIQRRPGRPGALKVYLSFRNLHALSVRELPPGNLS